MPTEPATNRPIAEREPTTARRPVSNLALIRKAALAQQLGVSTWTLDRWVRIGSFPRPIYLTDKSPAQWRVRDIEALIDKRRVARRRKPKTQGQLKQQGGSNAR